MFAGTNNHKTQCLFRNTTHSFRPRLIANCYECGDESFGSCERNLLVAPYSLVVNLEFRIRSTYHLHLQSTLIVEAASTGKRRRTSTKQHGSISQKTVNLILNSRLSENLNSQFHHLFPKLKFYKSLQ